MSLSTHVYDDADVDNGLSADIREMINEKANTCISVIIPTHRMGQDRQGDRVGVQQAVSDAKKEASFASPKLLDALNDLYLQVDYNHNMEGIGLFVSPSVSKLVKFPFPVTRKIVVNKFFHLHELLYLENYRVKYYLLQISQKEIHLFTGAMDSLQEIKEGSFPKLITDDYEYSKPSQSSVDAGYAHVKSFEKDKTILRQMRLKKILGDIDKALSSYLTTKKTPLILCGPEEDISIFESVTRHADNIAGTIADNRKHTELFEMEQSAWVQIRSFVDRQKLKLIEKLKEKVGEGTAVFGIRSVRDRVREGKKMTLLVEKHYEMPARRSADMTAATSDAGNDKKTYGDMINEVIAQVLKRNGGVIIVERDALKDYEHIALMLH